MITITGNLKDVFGNPDLLAGLRVTLNGYGPNMPRVSGTGIIVNPDVQVTMPGDGTFSFTVNGNDVITPGPNTTFYSIAFQPGSGGTVKTLNYQFSGSGSFDLSTLSPMVALPLSVPPISPVVTNPTGLQVIATFALQSRLVLPPNTIACLPATVFDCNGGTRFDLLMTQNVASSTIINGIDGEIVVFDFLQNGVGGFTFVYPANVFGGALPETTANVRSRQLFQKIGSNFYSLGAMQFN